VGSSIGDAGGFELGEERGDVSGIYGGDEVGVGGWRGLWTPDSGLRAGDAGRRGGNAGAVEREGEGGVGGEGEEEDDEREFFHGRRGGFGFQI